MQVLWLSHFKVDLVLGYNQLTGTLPIEIGKMNELGKLLCTHCLNSLMDFGILYDYLYIFVMKIWFEYGECYLTKIFHHLQVLWLSNFKYDMFLYNNTLTGTLPTEMGNMNLSKLLCTHCLNSLMDFAFCMNICIYLLWNYDLNMESFNWPKYLTTCKSCDFLISKSGWFFQINN